MNLADVTVPDASTIDMKKSKKQGSSVWREMGRW